MAVQVVAVLLKQTAPTLGYTHVKPGGARLECASCPAFRQGQAQREAWQPSSPGPLAVPPQKFQQLAVITAALQPYKPGSVNRASGEPLEIPTLGPAVSISVVVAFQ